MSKFIQKLIQIVKKIPNGKVASYGQIALYIGLPGAARAVGQGLKSLEEDIVSSKENIPWWRVVNNLGRVSIKGTKFHDAPMQAKLLRQEGIPVEKDFSFDIEKYRWRPAPDQFELDEDTLERLLTKYYL